MSKIFSGFYLSAILLLLSGVTRGQTQTVGLFTHLSGSEDNGYVLFAPQYADTTYLIDKCGRLVHKWAADYQPGMDAYILPDGSLLRSGHYPNPVFDAIIGTIGGVIERYDWNGDLQWRYVVSDSTETQNHDIWPMPNGNVLVDVWEVISDSEAIASGRNPALIGTSLWSAKVEELQPVGTDSAIVVWQWRAWDHLIQDYDSTKPNYGVVAAHPELLNLNFLNTAAAAPSDPDWLHLNQVTYNPALDQVMLSAHNISEIWIIDHSTTTAQAASHSGGVHNKGGDFLYRWGNPQAYRRSTSSNTKLFLQHDPEWITTGKYANQIMIFNNGNGRPGGNASSVDIIAPPIDSNGNYTLAPGAAYGPASAVWSYEASPPSSFYSAYEGSAQTLANGNILICQAIQGRYFEIDSNKNLVWNYIDPVVNGVPVAQGTIVLNNWNATYRCSFYPDTFAGFTGHILAAGMPIESNPIVTHCTVTATASIAAEHSIKIFPNPAYDDLTISSDGNIDNIAICNMLGQQVLTANYTNMTEINLNIADLQAGIYLIRVNGNVVMKFMKE